MKKILILMAYFLGSTAFADDIYVHEGGISSVTVNGTLGTLVEFPYPINVVSDSTSFSIERVETEVNSSGQAVNIRIVKVKPNRPGAIETIPFIMAGRKSVSIRFVTAPDAPKHQRLKYPERQGVATGGKFLGTEMTLMKQMLKDESGEGFQKTVLNRRLSIEGFDRKLKMSLVRRWEGQGLFGYTFKIVNRTSEAVTLNPQALNFESPNRAILLQTDHERLEPCSANASMAPSANGCVTALRLVVRSEKFNIPSSGSDLPFRIGGEQP
jgi:hypothetical protein